MTHPNTTTLTATNDVVAAAVAAELLSLAEQADANAARYDGHLNDHGGIGSASRAYRNVATSLRWRAQLIRSAAEEATA
jgi:hypothetical protein